MGEINFISDFHTGKYIADSLPELKRLVAAKLDRPIDWSDKLIKVGGLEVESNYVFPSGTSEVRVHQTDIKGGH